MGKDDRVVYRDGYLVRIRRVRHRTDFVVMEADTTRRQLCRWTRMWELNKWLKNHVQPVPDSRTHLYTNTVGDVVIYDPIFTGHTPVSDMRVGDVFWHNGDLHLTLTPSEREVLTVTPNGEMVVCSPGLAVWRVKAKHFYTVEQGFDDDKAAKGGKMPSERRT